MSYQGDNTEHEIDLRDELRKQTELLKLIAAILESALETGIEPEDLK